MENMALSPNLWQIPATFKCPLTPRNTLLVKAMPKAFSRATLPYVCAAGTILGFGEGGASGLAHVITARLRYAHP